MKHVVLVLLLASGCAERTTETVSVVSDTATYLQSLAAHVQVADGSPRRDVEFTATPVRLPTRFTVPLPDVVAMVTVTLDGVDAIGQPVHVAEAV